MPSWPAETRDDEVWAVTAFVTQLPHMSAEEYAALGKGVGRGGIGATGVAAETPGELFALSDAALIGGCARCHGVDGSGRASGAFPRIDGQASEYLYRALSEYASGVRRSGIMQPIAAALEDFEKKRLADHYAGSAGASKHAPAEPNVEALDRGRELAAIGDPERGIPPCSACHGAERAPVNPLFPSLFGQYEAYLSLQLHLFKTKSRGGGPYARIMNAIAANMSAEDMRAAAHYYASLPAGGAAPSELREAAPD
jgi:cytochrome c553